jgi:hypothetical protein
MDVYTDDALYELIESLDPLPSSGYDVDLDMQLLCVLAAQLQAIIRSPPPYPSETAPLAAVICVLIGRCRAIAEPRARATALQTILTNTPFGAVLVEVIRLRVELLYGAAPVEAEEGNNTFRVGCGGFTAEQTVAVASLWIRYSHAWPLELSQEKQPCLLKFNSSFHRTAFMFNSTVSPLLSPCHFETVGLCLTVAVSPTMPLLPPRAGG